ncbi:MAG: DUF1292 domain-containing protein [Ruminococcaceae bacterium]|nr:DUF1292 domain-containing protein [Oscillospiraceae bacterium]
MADDNLNLDALEDEGYDPDILTLEDEDGREHTFEVLDAADIDGQRYLAVVPYSADPAQALAEDAEMLLMRVGEDAGEEYLDIVEDEDELQTVGQVFLNRLSEVYNIDLDALTQDLDD